MDNSQGTLPSTVEFDCSNCGHVHTIAPAPETPITEVVDAGRLPCQKCGGVQYVIKLTCATHSGAERVSVTTELILPSLRGSHGDPPSSRGRHLPVRL